jgi:hypothetical protein
MSKRLEIHIIIFATVVLSIFIACMSPPPKQSSTGGAQAGSAAITSTSNCAEFCQHQTSCMPTIINLASCQSICEQQASLAPMMPHCLDAFKVTHACIDKLSCEDLKGQIGLQMPTMCASETKRFQLYCSQNVPIVAACLNNCDMRARCGEVLDVENCAFECLDVIQKLNVTQGLDCWNAASIVVICESTLSCRERKDMQERRPNKCDDRIQEQAAKCPLPK